MTEDDTDLTDRERQLLVGAHADVLPPAELEGRTLDRLRGEGTFAGSSPRPRLAPWIGAAAALALGFFLGRGGGDEPRETVDERPAFLLLLHSSTEQVASIAPEENARRRGEYGSWAHSLGSDLVDGAELGASPEAVERAGDEARVRPLVGDEQVDGYFVVRAADRTLAAEIAADCPHLAYGGWVELRQVVE